MSKIIVNGVPLKLAKNNQLCIRIEVDPEGVEMEQINIEIVGGMLKVRNLAGHRDALRFVAKEGGRLYLQGAHAAISIVNENQPQVGREFWDDAAIFLDRDLVNPGLDMSNAPSEGPRVVETMEHRGGSGVSTETLHGAGIEIVETREDVAKQIVNNQLRSLPSNSDL